MGSDVLSQSGTSEGVRRLNWGCGSWTEPGWINSDIKGGPGVDIASDIRDGLPLADNSIDYVVAIHSLPELPLDALVPALSELLRVLRPGGTLRVGLPDLDRAIDAYRAGRVEYFLVPDADARSMGGKFITQLLWYGYSRSLFTADFAEELLNEAGFVEARHCSFQQTIWGPGEIVELDNRPAESLFMEALKPGNDNEHASSNSRMAG
jgi:SAM-dependent methyltransferase